MGGIPVERFIMDEASWRDILGWGLTASVQAPLQISHLSHNSDYGQVSRQPYPLPDEQLQRMRDQIMAA